MAGKVLQEVAQVALITVIITSPLVHVRVCGEVLTPEAISTSVRVHIAILQDARLHILVDLSHNTSLRLVNLVQSQVLWQMDDLRTFKG